MKRSNNKQKEMTAALYVRLSRDDNLEGDSYSIGNQKKLLTKIAKEKGYTNLLIFCDDGISGVTMERPGYKAMIEAIENNGAWRFRYRPNRLQAGGRKNPYSCKLLV